MAKESKKEPGRKSENPAEVSRRSFLSGTGGVGAVIGAAAAGMASPSAFGEGKDASTAYRVTDEPAIPAVIPAPKTTEFQSDVLVIGGGFAGLNAAMGARKAGRSVVLVDKGKPGFSGLSSFASSHRWFDSEFGDDADAFRATVQRGAEYIVNLNWLNVWIKESKEAFQRLKEWGLMDRYPNAVTSGHFPEENYVGYREKFADRDRRPRFTQTLKENGIDCVAQTMITDLIEQDGRIVGAIGFDVPSGTVLTFRAKAVVMCMGGGSYKPSGFPTAGNTFDGEYIGYNLGLPIIGKEFDDFHMTPSISPGNAFLSNSWEYLENMYFCGGDITKKNAALSADTKGKILIQGRILKALKGLAVNDGTAMTDLTKGDATRRGATVSGNPLDLRTGKKNAPTPVEDIVGSAIGMCLHLTSGVFCGLDDVTGYAGIPGLYVAGDGINGCAVTGSAYPHGVGFTSNFCSVQGWRAGQAAASAIDSVGFASIPSSRIAEMKKAIVAPLNVKTGLDPNWARDVLHSIMAPYWIHIAKQEKALTSALAQVEMLRDEVVPKLMAASPHDLRLCHEMKHKVLSAEMKLRASLERKESRGMHYRSDYPFRDDKNFLAYIALRKDAAGAMVASKIEVKDEWKGDVGEEYTRRYGWRFPGEAKAKGLAEEPAGAGAPGAGSWTAHG